MLLHNIVKAFYTSGEERNYGTDYDINKDPNWKNPAYVESKRKFFEEIDKSEKERLIRDKNANWPFRKKLRIMRREGGLNGLEEEFVWVRYRVTLLFRKLFR